jgi:hypothetical protein
MIDIPPIRRAAGFSRCGRYRYWLMRTWTAAKPVVCWVMLNPSTADAERDDPTIRRCIGFSRRWDFGGLVVVNLFAWKATRPNELTNASDPIGPRNDSVIVHHTAGRRVIVAWGTHGDLGGRDRTVLQLLANASQVECLGVTNNGQPKHPLYVASICHPLLRLEGRWATGPSRCLGGRT